MVTLLSALLGFAVLDSLDVLLVGLTAAIALHARLTRRSPWRGGLAFVGGVFASTVLFGAITVLGIGFITALFDFTLTPTVRYWGQGIVAIVLIALASLPTRDRPAPRWARTFGSSVPAVALTGAVIGMIQGPTAVPYLAGLAMLSTHDPLPTWWPAIVPVYCAIALLPPLVVLFLASRRSPRSRRAFATTVRALTRYGPPTVRVVFLVLGLVLAVDVALHAHHLFPGRT